MAELKIIPSPGDAPKLSENALTVLQSRYLIKDEHGKCIETPAQLFSRVAALVADAEAKYGVTQTEIGQWHKKFYDLMASLKFLPNSPALMNANRPNGMLSACFVLPIEDSIEAIFETIKQKGNVHLFRSEYSQAMNHYELALDYYRKNNNVIGISRCLNNMGIIHKNRGDYVEALSVYQESIV